MKFIFKSIVVSILTIEARLLLRRAKPTIIAVTGSVGKTSTKDAIYAVIKDHYSARKSEKSYNSDIGVPLSILGLQNAWNNPFLWIKNIIDGFLIVLVPHEYPDVLVLEMGVDRPGDMEKFTRWIKPDVVVLTRLPDVPVHVEYFTSPEAVIEEKIQLVAALKENGVLIYNNDDEKVREVAKTIPQKIIGYSRYSPTDFAATQDVIRYEDKIPAGITFTLTHQHTAVTVEIDGGVGVQHAYAAAAAAATGSLFEIPLEGVVQALHGYVPAPGRMRLLEGIKETLILDDTYNSSPVAVERALLTLKEMRGVKRRIAILGDMLELGKFSVDAHHAVGALAASSVTMLITVGVRARTIAEGAIAHGMLEENIMQYDDAERVGAELPNILEKGDVVLVKGSQGVRLENVVLKIMAEPDRANDLLVRQGAVWKKQ
ncbi:MAG: UDP-N-acetylmuramoyl-tripeptide--D-alanyl-D-alanine ligase [Candidatus Paceibacterota bacterium]